MKPFLSAKAALVALASAAAAAAAALASPPALAQDDDRIAPRTAGEMRLSFAPVAREAAPAVVNVYSTRVVRARSRYDDFFGPGWDEFMGMPRQRLERSLGSGVIVRPDGVVVTNNHVVSGAVELRVVLNDRREYDADLLLTDTSTDLAVLRIRAGEGDSFPILGFGDTSALEVGDLVLAIGNPFGVGQTVTQGIVSGLARTEVGASEAQSFIQTDAAINPGNSGGALVDIDARLVGVNTAIFSRSGGSNGVGFAIPVEIVERVVEAAVTGGHVLRPWFGARFQPVTADIAASLGLDRPAGVLVSEVFPGGPAERAGVLPGDVALAIDDAEVNDAAAVNFQLLTRDAGEAARLRVRRGEAVLELGLPVETPPETPPRDARVLTGAHPFDSVEAGNLSPALNQELGGDLMRRGVALIRVGARSFAARLGLRAGDVILDVNGYRVETAEDLESALANEAGARTWTITYERGGARRVVRFAG